MEGAIAVNIKGQRAYVTEALPLGSYTFQVKAFGKWQSSEGTPSATCRLKVLSGPNDENTAKGREHVEYFSLSTEGDNPAVGWLMGFFERLAPGSMAEDKCLKFKGHDGLYPNVAYLTGGKGGKGAIFTGSIVENKYEGKKGARTVHRLERGSVQLVQLSSFAEKNLDGSNGKKGKAATDDLSDAEPAD